MPGDWGGGFYPHATSQAEVILRLLMYGIESDVSNIRGDVTTGQIYGLGYNYIGNSKVWSVDRFKTGFDGIRTRSPEHL